MARGTEQFVFTGCFRRCECTVRLAAALGRAVVRTLITGFSSVENTITAGWVYVTDVISLIAGLARATGIARGRTASYCVAGLNTSTELAIIAEWIVGCVDTAVAIFVTGINGAVDPVAAG